MRAGRQCGDDRLFGEAVVRLVVEPIGPHWEPMGANSGLRIFLIIKDDGLVKSQKSSFSAS
jgi:hypothetical protein